MKNSIIGYPRIGQDRELKFAIEKYFKNQISESELQEVSKEIRKNQFNIIKDAGVDIIPSNDFSFYDAMLDTAVMLNVIPSEFKKLQLSELDTYFAMARGYQGSHGDVKALSMKKWFNTNYHYIVPEFEDDTKVELNTSKPIDLYVEAEKLGIKTKPVLVGPFTFLKLSKFRGTKKAEDFVNQIVLAYKNLINKFNELKVEWLQLDEPYLVTDLSSEDKNLFKDIYSELLSSKGNVKVLLQTYFGDVRDYYNELLNYDFDGIGIDFVEGKKSQELLENNFFPDDKVLFAGLVNGKNIWKNNYEKTIEKLNIYSKYAKNIVLNTSCSLLHVPYTLKSEKRLENDVTKYFAFAEEKLTELKQITDLYLDNNYKNNKDYLDNASIFNTPRDCQDKEVQDAVNNLASNDFIRSVSRKEREKIQKEEFKLPILPTTTIGSFPQTKEVKSNRSKYRKNEITKEEYDKNIFKFIKECIKLQEDIGLDVLVHGEYERNDMVEFFGENLQGFVFTDKAWVQSYGTRCVKPPIIFGDVKRIKPITVEYSQYAQSLTDKPVKGMLTGPITIINWSFPREDISIKDISYQIGLAIREEVNDLEKAGIKIIQIDEAALKEKLPLRKEDWYSEYLDFAIKAFRLCQSKVKPETQIHTHMCYSEFEDIVKAIDDMDADVITFEASRSKFTIIDALVKNNFETEVGPGVYDIHSARVPSVEEIVDLFKIILSKIDKEKLWINPDCGLKTRGIEETKASLINLVKAAKQIRETL